MNYKPFINLNKLRLIIGKKKYKVGNILEFFIINGPEGSKLYQCIILQLNQYDKTIEIGISNIVYRWNLKILYMKYLENKRYKFLNKILKKHQNKGFYTKYKSKFNHGDLISFKNGRRAKIINVQLKIRSVPHRFFPEIYFDRLQYI